MAQKERAERNTSARYDTGDANNAHCLQTLSRFGQHVGTLDDLEAGNQERWGLESPALLRALNHGFLICQ
jgi:hypothetical protein